METLQVPTGNPFFIHPSAPSPWPWFSNSEASPKFGLHLLWRLPHVNSFGLCKNLTQNKIFSLLLVYLLWSWHTYAKSVLIGILEPPLKQGLALGSYIHCTFSKHPLCARPEAEERPNPCPLRTRWCFKITVAGGVYVCERLWTVPGSWMHGVPYLRSPQMEAMAGASKTNNAPDVGERPLTLGLY